MHERARTQVCFRAQLTAIILKPRLSADGIAARACQHVDTDHISSPLTTWTNSKHLRHEGWQCRDVVMRWCLCSLPKSRMMDHESIHCARHLTPLTAAGRESRQPRKLPAATERGPHARAARQKSRHQLVAYRIGVESAYTRNPQKSSVSAL